MTPSPVFAARVFRWAAIYGVLVLLPMYVLESRMAEWFPPTMTHVENYYGFLAAALVWQWVYWRIGSDVIRFRPMMPPAIAVKLLFAATLVVLYLIGRTPVVSLAPVGADGLIGLLFVIAYRRTPNMRSP